ncbi:lateral signaling target protein 2 homolog isoform X2 [Atheta coriaria]|uniref:lateral signaling target protein 2 homolog isoform X2 n=1 Tax=Dalotia coriaria TaxID=877792 RepID=UPI0031F3FC45
MHFWINKSQGCGFNGRYVPPSISAGTRRNQVPKPMVTPVHRFQSIESVASGGLHAHLHGHHGQNHSHQSHHHAHHQHPPSGHHQSHRHPRAPSYHTRFPVPQQNASSHQRSSRRVSIDYVSNGHRGTLTPINSSGGHGSDGTNGHVVNSTTAKLKCGVWAIISLVPFMVVASKYYLHGESVGAELLVFLIMLLLILLAVGFVSLFEAFSQKRTSRSPSVVQISSEQNDTFEESHASSATNPPPTHAVVNMSAANVAALELPPPPYHIAVTLPPAHPHNERLTIIQDSPPPTYEKAVT